MNRRVLFAVAVALVAVMVAGAIGTVAYRAGVAQGLSDAGKLPSDAMAYWHYRPYWHHGPFGFFGIVFPLLFLFLVLGLARGLFWGRWCGPGGRSGDGVPPMFEEWHRRAHEPPPPGPRPSA